MNKTSILLVACLFGLVTHLAEAQSNALWVRQPSISPDGKTIVFSYKGDLFKINAAGGVATLLSSSSSHEMGPVWSPDGQNIAFASDRYGNFDVFVIPVVGGDSRRLTFNSSGDMPATFTKDGKHVLFNASRQDPVLSVQFPSGILHELYQVPISGGRAEQVLAIPAESAQLNADGSKMLFHDQKGYEDPLRKHHKSSIARDIWMHDVKTGKYSKITTFEGEDRSAWFLNDNEMVYLSEESGDFNVHKMSLSGGKSTQMTQFKKHPVRFLSKANDGTLCFTFDGEVYTLKQGAQPQKISIVIPIEQDHVDYKNMPVQGGTGDMALSPNGKEIAFVYRGEVFVTAVDGAQTKRITNTAAQERTVSFHPDGRSIIYATERGNSWDVYKASIVRKEEPYFFTSTVVKEEALVATDADEFQPAISPDGKEVAYLEERVILKVLNTVSKATRQILGKEMNYSYSDGDQYYEWSPDGKWFLTQFLPKELWVSEIGLISADGKGKIVNLTENGYDDGGGRWMNKGKMMIFESWRDGQKNHGSWGAQSDIYGIFFTKDAFDRYKLSKEEFALVKEKEDKEKKEKEEADKKADAGKKKKDEKKEALEVVKMELDGIQDRKARLTIHSSNLADAIVGPNADKLFYLSKFEKGYNLWVTNLRDKETKILAKLDASGAGGLQLDKEGKNIFFIADGKIMKVEVENGKSEPVAISGEMKLDQKQERSYIFDHCVRQVAKKFYKTDLHGLDWNFYTASYRKFLPHINNNYDYEEMLSELLGELNASHTGGGFRYSAPTGDRTASLGLLFDLNYKGEGLKIAEVLKGGPLDNAESKVKAGMIIEKIDEQPVTSKEDPAVLLNRRGKQQVLLSLAAENGKSNIEQVVKLIEKGEENELMYKRWVDNRRKEVDKLSGGKIGYVHVRGMNDGSYRVVYEEVLGKNIEKDALIVDTRFNGGGWLHDDLATFLGGKKYVDLVPREQKIGSDPTRKWTKPSVVLMSESNYSDAHFFPFVYKELGVGKLVGMPVPGTATAVWWESQIDPSLYFGIPQVGVRDNRGNYLENMQLEPDFKQHQDPEVLLTGRDQQLEKAVEVLLMK